MFFSNDRAHGQHSGYTVIQKYIEGAEIIEEPRREQGGAGLRLANAALSRLAACSWFRLGSGRAECRAVRVARKNPGRIVHMLWADRDWGFIDRLLPKETPLVGTFHQPAAVLEKIIKRKRLKRFNGVIVMSSAQRDFFLEAGLPSERVQTVLHGVDVDFFQQGDSAHPRSIAFVGNYLRNFDTLQSVCKLLAKDNVRVVIVSGKQHRSRFDGLPHVEFRSGLTDRELVESYQSASCFLMTVEDATANNGILEALACGVPVVSEDVGGIAEYVDSECARLCRHEDAIEIAEQIRSLLSSSELLSRMRAAARKRALELRWELVAERTVDFYETVVSYPRLS